MLLSLRTDWVDKGRNDQGTIDGQKFASEAFRSQRIWEDLRRIRHQKWSVSNVIMKEEGEEADDDNDSGGLRTCVMIDSGAGCPDDVRDEHANATPHEQGPASETIDQESPEIGQPFLLFSTAIYAKAYAERAAQKLKIC